MKKFLTILLLPLAIGTATAQITANSFSSTVPYTGLYAYGTNVGYYGSQFSVQNISQLAYNAGVRTLRPSLPDYYITPSPGFGITAFQYYQSIGIIDPTAFLGFVDPSNRDTTTFPGCDSRTWIWRGLYQPIWNTDGSVDTANTFANYVYKAVSNYGPYVKFWEIINEPDYTGTAAAWQDSTIANSWWNVNPAANDLYNLKAPVFYYIRILRIAWEVIKKLQPNEYVCNGVGFPSFLDVVLRNTDNPVDGSVTSAYPNKGGAYFDVLAFHAYPFYTLNYWDNACGCTKYRRYSDTLVDVLMNYKTQHQYRLGKYGYNGTTYPLKQYIITETDLPRKQVGSDWGSNDAAINYIIKYNIYSQVNGIAQTYKYGLGQGSDTTSTFNWCGLYGDLTPPSTTITNASKNPQFYAFKTMSDAMYGKRYDAAQTALLKLPSTIRGAAFKDAAGIYTYVLWAKTTTDLSEVVSASYTFPFAISGRRREWNYSSTNTDTTVTQTVALNGFPSFFISPGSIVLPIKLISFNAITNGCSNIVLSWKTTNENSGKYYQVESSTDGNNFTDKGIILSNETANTNAYNYIYNGIAGTPYFFRLKMADGSGNITYSPVITFTNNNCIASAPISSGPNPAGSFFRINNLNGHTNFITLYNSSGQQLIKTFTSGNSVSINMERFPPGTYIIKIISEEGEILKTMKVIH